MTRELNLRAILFGFATIFGFGLLTGFLSGIVLANLLIPNFPPEEKLAKDVAILILATSVTSRFSGGFVTGWIAKHHQIKNAFALAVLDLVLSRAIMLFSGSGPVLSTLVNIATDVLAVLCGGYLAKLAFRRMELRKG